MIVREALKAADAPREHALRVDELEGAPLTLTVMYCINRPTICSRGSAVAES